MKIRIDINKPLSKKEKPELVGLWVECFGRIIGGATTEGTLSFVIDVENDEYALFNGSDSTFRKFLKRVRSWNWQEDDLWEVKK